MSIILNLSLLAMMTSIQGAEQCIIDAGIKVLTIDNGIPEIIKLDGHKLLKLNEEDGVVSNNTGKENPIVGMCIEIIPSHVYTTVNKRERYYVIQDDQFVDIWEISGWRKSQ
jgi:3-hydroxy-D-aspartate aldolase